MRNAGIELLFSSALFLWTSIAAGAELSHFSSILPTGNSATVMVPASINPIVGNSLITEGDEIAVFDSTGTCVGAEVWEGENLALRVHGDDATEAGQYGIMPGESYQFRMWDTETDQEYRAKASYESGDSLYVPDALAVLATLLGDTPVAVETSDRPDQFRLLAVFPNPFNNTAAISYELHRPGTVVCSVHTITGQRIVHHELGYTAPGLHTLAFDGSGLSSGTYLFSIAVGGHVETIGATLLK